MKTLEELNRIRERMKPEIILRKEDKAGVRIIVCMGTCGFEAGARDVLAALVNEVNSRMIPDTMVTQTGCIGMCDLDVYKRQMLYLSENLKKYRLLKNLTQEDVAEYLGITSQSVSKWERGESYPDITFLPTLANIFETSVDLLIGMDTIRAEEARFSIHEKAVAYRCV